MKRLKTIFFIAITTISVLFSCTRQEIDVEEISQVQSKYAQTIFQNTIYKPGPPTYEIGIHGNTYHDYLQKDPKSFNRLNARDSFTAQITNYFSPALFDYDLYKKEFVPNVASFEVRFDMQNDVTFVDITLRDDLFWTTANGRKTKITVDDLIYWYYEVEGDPSIQQPGYPGQFITTQSGERARISLTKTDDLRATFTIPTILANPLLTINTSFGPRYLYQSIKEEKGALGLLDILSIDTNPKDVPTAGQYMLSEFQTGQYVRLEKNPNYWKKDKAQNSLPYIESIVYKIIPSQDTALLSFKNGNLTGYSPRPEDLDSLIQDQEKSSYDVYSRGPSLGSSFITFNQNPNVLNDTKYKWFSNKYFRQAMSRLIPRERIIKDVFQGLGSPAIHFFATPNAFFDEKIVLQYQFDPQKAATLLAKAGFSINNEGKYVDDTNTVLEFDLFVGVENTINIDIASLFADELNNVGITLNIKTIDFQNLVERLTKNYNWDAVIVALGANYFPSTGSNVWQSSGNFHLWYPLQKTPETEWETRIDNLYQTGQRTTNFTQRKKIYDEFQTILLEELPLIYLVHPISFTAFDSHIQNLYVDNLEGSKLSFLYFSE